MFNNSTPIHPEASTKSVSSSSKKHAVLTPLDVENFARRKSAHRAMKNTNEDSKMLRMSWAGYLFRTLHDGFIGTVPLDAITVFPGKFLFFIGITVYVVMFASYIIFFAVSFIDTRQDTFVSLSKSAGICQEVAKPVTGTFLASRSGSWEGAAGPNQFRFSDTTYRFKFTDLLADKKQFDSLISNDFSIDEIGLSMESQDVAYNLLVWMQYRKIVLVNNKVQIFDFVSSPSEVFSRNYILGGVFLSNPTNGSTNCQSKNTNFDTNDAVVQFQFGLNDPNCQEVISQFPILTIPGSTDVYLEGNLNSLASAAAINFGIMDVNELEVTRRVRTGVVMHGEVYDVDEMYDPKYERADFFYCSIARNQSAMVPRLCLVVTEDIVFIPALAHVDEHCTDCSDTATKSTYPCKDPFMVPFFMFYPAIAYDTQATAERTIELLLQDPTAVSLRKGISRLISSIILSNSSSAAAVNSTLFESACPDCGIIWSLHGDSAPFITPYGKTFDLHCKDSVTSANFTLLGKTAPSQLVESRDRHQQCN